LEELTAKFEEVQTQKDTLQAECAHYKVTLQETVSTLCLFVLLAGSAFINPKILLGSNESVWHGVKRYKKLWLKPTNLHKSIC